MKPSSWKVIWIYILGKVSHKDTPLFKRGEGYFHFTDERKQIGEDITPDTIKKFLQFSRKNEMLSTRRSTRGIRLKVLKYNKYQTFDNYTSTDRSTREALEKHQRSTTIYKKVRKKEDIPAKAGRKLKTNSKDMRKTQSEDPDDLPSIQADTGEMKDPNDKKKSISTLLVEWAEERRGRSFLQKPKQFVALKRMLTAKISPTEIAERYKELESTEFGKRVGIDFMSVFNSFEKKI